MDRGHTLGSSLGRVRCGGSGGFYERSVGSFPASDRAIQTIDGSVPPSQTSRCNACLRACGNPEVSSPIAARRWSELAIWEPANRRKARARTHPAAGAASNKIGRRDSAGRNESGPRAQTAAGETAGPISLPSAWSTGCGRSNEYWNTCGTCGAWRRCPTA
jgi:hypothetical protein